MKHLGVCVCELGREGKRLLSLRRGDQVGVLAGTEIPQLEYRENCREREINERERENENSRGKQSWQKKNRGEEREGVTKRDADDRNPSEVPT